MDARNQHLADLSDTIEPSIEEQLDRATEYDHSERDLSWYAGTVRAGYLSVEEAAEEMDYDYQPPSA